MKAYLKSVGLAGFLIGGWVCLIEHAGLFLFRSQISLSGTDFAFAMVLYSITGFSLSSIFWGILNFTPLKNANPSHTTSLTAGTFLAMVVGITGSARGWHHLLSSRLYPEHPNTTWALVLTITAIGAAVAFGFVVFLLRKSRFTQRLLCPSQYAISLVVATLIMATTPSLFGTEQPDRPNILLIIMDTTRADALSCYNPSEGYPTTPYLDRLASEGVMFTRAYSESSWTLPSHASLFTGLHLTQHGASNAYQELSSSHLTLAEYLRDYAGYNTIGFTNNKGYVTKKRGFDQGFDEFYEMWDVTQQQAAQIRPKHQSSPFRLITLLDNIQSSLLADTEQTDSGQPNGWTHHPIRWKRARETVTMASRWMNRYRSTKPFFMFINVTEPHHPYVPPNAKELLEVPEVDKHLADAAIMMRDLTDPYEAGAMISQEERDAFNRYRMGITNVSTRFQKQVHRRYSEEVRYLDNELGKLFTYMRHSDLLDSTFTIVTSDHGESFGEQHVWKHPAVLLENLINIPLIIRYPARYRSGMIDKRLTQTIDLFPTVEYLIDQPIDWMAEQRSGSSLLIPPPRPQTPVIAQRLYVVAPTTHSALLRAKAQMLLKGVDKTVLDLENNGRSPKFISFAKRLAAIDEQTESGQELLSLLEKEVHTLKIPLDMSPEIAIYNGHWKYVWRAYLKHSLFDMRTPSPESIDLIEKERDVADSLCQRLVQIMSEWTPADISQPANLTDEDKAGARALGYTH